MGQCFSKIFLAVTIIENQFEKFWICDPVNLLLSDRYFEIQSDAIFFLFCLTFWIIFDTLIAFKS